MHVCMHVYRHAHSLSVYTCFSVFITKSINTLSLSIHHPHTLSGYASLRLSTQCAYRVFKSVHLSVYAYRHAHSLCLQTCTQSLVHTVSTSIHLSVYPHTQSIETFKERASKRELQRDSFKERASKRELQRESFKERASKRELQRESFKVYAES